MTSAGCSPLSQSDQMCPLESVESILLGLQGFARRGPERRERMRVWYRRFCYENGIPLRVPYNPGLELPEARAFEQWASSPEVISEVSRSQDIAIRLIASIPAID